MKKWTLILASALSVNLVSAQYNSGQFNDFIGTISPVMNGFVNGLFGTNMTDTGWLSIAAFFVLIAVLLNTLMKRNAFMNESKGLRIAISVIGTYFLVNNPVMLERVIPGIGNVASIVIMAGSLLLLTWLLPLLTMGSGMRSRQAKHKEKSTSRKETKQIKSNEKLNYIEEYMSAQEKQLEENQKRLEQTEDSELIHIIGELHEILQETDAEILFKKYMGQAKKLSKTVGNNPMQTQQIEQRYNQYQAKLEEYERKIHVVVDRLAQQIAVLTSENEQEKTLIEKEEQDVKKEIKIEKKIIKTDKKILKEEIEEVSDSHLPDVKRMEEKGKEEKTIAEINLEKNKSELIKEKTSFISKKNSLKSNFESDNKQITKYLSEIKQAEITPEQKKNVINGMIKIINTNAAINKEMEQINTQLENINTQLKQLEDQALQLEKAEESDNLRTAA